MFSQRRSFCCFVQVISIWDLFFAVIDSRFCYSLMAWRLFFFLQEEETDKEEPERPGVIVSNHVSYLDILYHMSASFPSFVAKVSC